MNSKIATDPKVVFAEFQQGNNFKSSIGDRGIFDQSKLNENFYIGNQWVGAKCGNDRPLVRRNIIKRIGEQKLSSIATAPIAVSYSAEGIPDNAGIEEEKKAVSEAILGGGHFTDSVEPSEVSFITDVLSEYWRLTAERVKFDTKKELLLRNAYISGTGIAYTYWDSSIKTGLFADQNKQQPITGDIGFEILNVENVNFGDPNNDDIQSQPYIIISQRIECSEVRREAKRNGIPDNDILDIVPDGADAYFANAGTIGEKEPSDSRRVTVLTKFWKEWDKNGKDYKIMCVRMTEKVQIRRPWSLGIQLYPFAKMCWLPRYSCAYGDSEITYLIPNQIAINRALSSEVWSLMLSGMPITVVNGDIVTEPLTNTPGQVVKVFGGTEDVVGAIRHIQPPAFGNQYITAIDNLANNTLSDAGANDAALGNLRPDNAAAIIQLREAALQPMQLIQNRFYSCVEDIARIWADIWMHNYGNRPIKYENKQGTFYVPFDSKRYENLLLNARIDVGSSPIWDISSTVAMLDAMFSREMITKQQYLERMPAGIIPDINGLKEDAKAEAQAISQMQTGGDDAMQLLAQQHPELIAKLKSLPPEQQQEILARISAQQDGNAHQEVGDI